MAGATVLNNRVTELRNGLVSRPYLYCFVSGQAVDTPDPHLRPSALITERWPPLVSVWPTP